MTDRDVKLSHEELQAGIGRCIREAAKLLSEAQEMRVLLDKDDVEVKSEKRYWFIDPSNGDLWAVIF